MIDWFLLLTRTFYGKLGTGCYLIKKRLIKTVLVNDFPVIILDEQDDHMLTSFRIVELKVRLSQSSSSAYRY